MKDENKINDASELIREFYEKAENGLIKMLNLALYEKLNFNEKEWKVFQLGLKRQKDINGKIGFYLKSTKEDLKKVIDNVAKDLKISPNELNKEIDKSTSQLSKSANKYFKHSVNKVVTIAPKYNTIRDAIIQQAIDGFDNGLTIFSKKGRRYEYKSYMDMMTRTTINNEIIKNQLELNVTTKNPFWLCNFFKDCAPDHKDFQGKIYFDERYKSFGFDENKLKIIEDLIKSKKMLSIQQVKDNKPYLTTRPNCRHKFMPISINQALGNTNELLKKLKMTTGNYEEKQYKMSQDLRYCERNIRKYKDLANNFEAMGIKHPSKSVDEVKDHYGKLVKEWEKRADGVVDKSNGNLTRYKMRESRKFYLRGVKDKEKYRGLMKNQDF